MKKATKVLLVLAASFGILLLGSGFLIARIGYPLTITASAALGLAFTILIGVRWRASMWRRRRRPTAAPSVPQRV